MDYREYGVEMSRWRKGGGRWTLVMFLIAGSALYPYQSN